MPSYYAWIIDSTETEQGGVAVLTVDGQCKAMIGTDLDAVRSWRNIVCLTALQKGMTLQLVELKPSEVIDRIPTATHRPRKAEANS